MKSTITYTCSSCGATSPQMLGRCPVCGEWGTFVEEVSVVEKSKGVRQRSDSKVQKLQDVSVQEDQRLDMHSAELNRVLGGGLVPGSLVLLGGEPGIGKSTLALQVLMQLGATTTLYASGEESVKQIKLRSERIAGNPDNLYIVAETSLEKILEHAKSLKPEIVVIDSIQTIEASNVEAAPGTISQVREVTARLLQIAKKKGAAIFIVGHVTKEGTVAGPRTLEHMVDSVLYFEGDNSGGFRLLRANKNRFGSTNEIGVFNMTDTGLEEVINPSEFFLSGRPEDASGSAVVCIIEGTRAMLVEIQALCTDSNFSMPKRTSVGLDYNRVGLLTAVLEKRGGINMSGCDCYVNVAGGLRINDPSTDLGVVLSIASSFRDRPIDKGTVIIGEIGLAGEIRGVRNISQRIKEAEKLGYTRVIAPKSNASKSIEGQGVEVVYVSNISEALKLV